MDKEVVNKSNIKISIGLDEEKKPAEIKWNADGSPNDNEEKDAKGVMVALFDHEHRETLRIDLWTNDMQVDEMYQFFYQSLRGMADTLYRSTRNGKLANDLQRFAQYFGEETEIIKKSKEQI